MIIRLATFSDAVSIYTIQHAVIKEDNGLITSPTEWAKQVDDVEKEINQTIMNDREVIFVAEENEVVVGYICCHSPKPIRLQHTASFEMMIKKSNPRKRVRRIAHSAFAFLGKRKSLLRKKISLGVLSSNEQAIKLYERFGFVEEGRKRNEWKRGPNDYADDVLMYVFV
ncbi:GNAT family N-acetyltransferase [Geomicrobium sp. JCM 19055]|uniref:GNAT family N-acetyltransferase n=1 Tax=Geomicrobium sp. JCM 19055 TaxID=1460649 RepID=UPI00045ECC6D|nr:GNAT family N-acetyltransferase [Geomicrobium sp. JCM 19055]GAJ97828.1 ribosomal-protein-alanine acetyltransferase [Geomicrobium sp. JCM 19055]